jgi:dihydrofolate synthase/folylpolyglutamate synthase
MEWQLVLGVRGERDVAELVTPLRGLVGSVFATAPEDPTAISADLVADAAGESLSAPATTFPSVLEALSHATEAAGAEGGVVVCGSLYLIGEARGEFEALGDRSRDAHLRIEAERDFDQELEDDDEPTD